MAYKISEDCIACGTCKDECPMGAISEGDRYSIDPDMCTECGTCADACPSGAISLWFRQSNSYLRRRGVPRVRLYFFVFTCLYLTLLQFTYLYFTLLYLTLLIFTSLHCTYLIFSFPLQIYISPAVCCRFPARFGTFVCILAQFDAFLVPQPLFSCMRCLVCLAILCPGSGLAACSAIDNMSQIPAFCLHFAFLFFKIFFAVVALSTLFDFPFNSVWRFVVF